MQKGLKTHSRIRVNTSSRSAGFTLVELMVVLAIMAIITVVAYPAYQESIRKSRRSDGIAAALSIQVAQEKFRAGCAVYATTFAASNTCTPLTMPPVYAVEAAATSPAGYYAMSLSGATGNAYVITATAQGAQAADTACAAMTITFNANNPNGLKAPAACWP